MPRGRRGSKIEKLSSEPAKSNAITRGGIHENEEESGVGFQQGRVARYECASGAEINSAIGSRCGVQCSVARWSRPKPILIIFLTAKRSPSVS